MRVVVDEIVFLFLKEYKIPLSNKLESIIENLKMNPHMYAMIADKENARHFIINGVDFGYFIEGDTIVISNCKFVKSKWRLRVKWE